MVFLQLATAFLWEKLLLVLIMALGVVLTFKTGFFAIRNIPKAFCNLFSGAKEKRGEVSAFGAMSTALAATMGTGNIVGVATAIAAGGAGAVFWMQLSALLGMTIKFFEIFLAAKYNNIGKGPFGYLKKIKIIGKPLAIMFAVSCLFASVAAGNMTQSNSAATSLANFYIPPILTAIFFGCFTFFATQGRIKGIVSFSKIIIPIITLGYLAISFWAIFIGRDMLFTVVKNIFCDAFSKQAAVGGATGYMVSKAIRFGLARGIFSNEAGMGTSPIIHGEVKHINPIQQGLWGVLEVFIDTTLSCTLTSLVVLIFLAGSSTPNLQSGGNLAILAFSSLLGRNSGILVAIFIALFGITSVCGWYTYGYSALEFLLPKNCKAIYIYRVIYAFGAAFGALLTVEVTWLLSDLLTGVMLLINCMGIAFLINEAKSIK